MRIYVEKILSLIFSFLIFNFLAIGIHEQGHYLAANLANVPGGYVTFSWLGGFYNYPTGVLVSQAQNVIVSVGGGFLTALVLGLLWYLANYQTRYTKWELDDCFALLSLAIAQFVYALFEINNNVVWGSVVGFSSGVFVAFLYYGDDIIDWLREE